MHHYNFPAFCVGEVGRYGAPGRREIGHGALGEKALLQVIPSEEEFPYTIRVVSDVLESNGSSSQASICAGCLSLMAAGVPIKAPVAGIAMGLITKGDKYTILTDIQGLEDHMGDMDFKVAGTRSGICAMQMDIKIKGVSREILTEALEQARTARFQVLDVMEEYRAWVVDRNVIKMRSALGKEEAITPALKKQLTNSIHQTMNDLYPYKGKKLKLQTIMQRQIYRFCSCIVKDNRYRGYHFKW